ncbi:hypothetical protein ACI1US_01780 [Leucobacter sp. BZR 635]
MPVAYAAIGASGAADLLRFPPAGSTPYEESLQLGSGQERFLTAANLLMTWGAHRAAGVDVADVERGEQGEYLGVQFGNGGTPELGDEPEELFSPEGEAYILPGTTATLTAQGKSARPIMVISTVDEPQRLGFAWGDREEAAGFGEQLITVEHREDGTVWAVARGFTFLTKTGLMAGIKQRAELREVIELAQAFLAGLAPGAAIRNGVVPPSDAQLTAEPSEGSTDAAPEASTDDTPAQDD